MTNKPTGNVGQIKTKMGFAAESRSGSLDSLASLNFEERFVALAGLSPEYGSINLQYGDTLADVCALFIHCTEHRKVCLSKADKGRFLWLPFVPVRTGETWKTATKQAIQTIITNNDLSLLPPENSKSELFKFRVVNILRIQLPDVGKFVTRITYDVPVMATAPGSNFKCCVDGKRTVWTKFEDVEKGWHLETKLFGAEPRLLMTLIKDASHDSIHFIEEFTDDDALVFSKDELAKARIEEVLTASDINPKHVLKLFTEFVLHCYPSFKMTLPSFASFCEKNGIVGDYVALFKIFQTEKKGYLTFGDFFLGLVATDTSTPMGIFRCGYVFNFYDQNSDGFLDDQDILRMTTDIVKLANKENTNTSSHPNAANIELEARQRWEAMHQPELMAAYNLKSKADPVPLPLFTEVVGKLLFRGTSGLVRVPVGLRQILERRTAESAQNIANSPSGIARRKYKGVCVGCRAKKYSHAVHSVKLDFQGRITSPARLNETEGRDLSFPLPYHNPTREQMNLYSIENIFSPTSTANYVIYTIRQLDHATFRRGVLNSPDDKNRAESLLWLADHALALRVITELCRKAEEMFSREPRVIKVSSPCFILGDIHGNLSDLMTYERTLWRKGPWAVAENFLFLGDYVDRGDWGVECVSYLLACKLIAPDKYFLCRGNHEIREIQQMFSFELECNRKYGPNLGPQIWELYNRVFDRMPICAVVDDSIYCAHGGIPFSDLRIDSLLKIPSPLPKPEFESPSAWQIMWNDPMNKDEFDKLKEFQRSELIRGFVPNDKRGTAYCYTEEAVDHFLQANGLTHIIRGHEVAHPGYHFHMNGKVTTIFSSSGYCGLDNRAAVAFVDNERITIVKVDTQTPPDR